jgi:glycosyltransferase involved in cell wall biosynthesis
MNILFWVPYPREGASNRYRVEQYLPYLTGSGIKYVLHPFWSREGYKILYRPGYFFIKMYYFFLGTFSRVKDIFSIGRYNIVFIHREAYPIGGAIFEKMIGMLGKPVIFDFDDAIFLPANSHQNNFIKMLKCPGKIKEIIRDSRCVIAGNEYLADFAKKFSKNVVVIPTSIDTDEFIPAPGKDLKSEIVVGWIGSGTTVGFINIIRGAIVRLSDKYPHIVFKIVGGDISIGHLKNVISKPWSLEEERADLSTFDIGIMPMDDNLWTKGKCGFKAILYMSMGIPCVSSPVGVNNNIIQDGISGFLARDEDDWFNKLSSLIEDGGLRIKIGAAGRKVVEEKYSVKANVKKVLDVITKSLRQDK